MSKYGDYRLEKKEQQLLSAMLNSQSSVIRTMSDNRAQAKSFYRYLSNDSVELSSVIEHQFADYKLSDQRGHVLCISDTTEINLQSHAKRLKASTLGVVGNNADIGFFIHPTLLLDAQSGECLGFSSIQIWTRAFDKLDKYQRNYEYLPIEQKESYKWICSMQDSRVQLSEALMLTMIFDREGDMYEVFSQISDEKTHAVVRACRNRKLHQSEEKLYEALQQNPIQGNIQIRIANSQLEQTTYRTVDLSVKFTKVQLQKPSRVKEGKEWIEVYAIEVKEIGTVQGIEPICWRLLTTHQVDSLEKAMQIVGYYKQRWWIEQLFRTLKKQGLKLEDTQLEDGEAIRKLSVYAMVTALKIMQLVKARNDNGVEITAVFDESEQQCLKEILPKVNGKTLKQQNPYQPSQLAWATWIVARLGGWDGFASQRPPGVITIHKGLEKFYHIFEARNYLFKDVGTQ
jgi:hypothetical protein